MRLKVDQPIAIQVDKRYVQHLRGYAIGDVYDALVELITNADDSYNRLFQKKQRNRDGGDILIEHQEQRKGKSCIVVRDKSEGMDSTDMEKKLLKMGAYSSESGNRGYMGRGAKDCTELGDLLYESIKDDRYFRCKITNDLKFILEVDGTKATREQRKLLELPDGNGTSVTLQLREHIRLPRFQSLYHDLPWHYALRDIMSEDSDSRVLLRKLGDEHAAVEKLVYRPPEGEIVKDETFTVDGYPDAKARIRILKAPEPIEEYKDRFEKFGILVKSRRAIHECTLFAEEFSKDPRARSYFGRLDCEYLDRLMTEYEERRAKGLSHPEDNACLVIDPNRRFGLDRRHKFVKALFQVPSELLRSLLAKDREQDKDQKREIANKETRARLGRLARLAGQFLRDQLDELEELGAGDAVDDTSLSKQGVLLYPTYLRVGVGKERAVTYYVKSSLLSNNKEPVIIEAEPKGAIEIIGSPFLLHPHKTKEDRLLGSFKIKGLNAWTNNTIVLTAKCNGLPKTDALVQVVETTIEERSFSSPLEFERDEYSIRQGSRKTIRIFAKYPEVVAQDSEAKVWSDDDIKVAVKGRCLLTPVVGSNYAEGNITVEGRTLKSKTNISAEINGRSAIASVKVIEQTDEDRSIPIDFEIRDEDFGAFRARWAVHEGRSNLLVISARHKSLARYLGPAPGFPGQDTPLFRVLLAEIIAERVCSKALTLEAQERPFDFSWRDLDPHLIADEVLAHMQKRLRDFVANAHSVMLSDQEIKSAQL
jgi:hypothetical protein